MKKSDQRVYKSNRVYLPSLDRPLSELKWSERRHLWWHLLPYLLEPKDRNERNRLRVLQCARLIERHNKKRAKYPQTSRQHRTAIRLKKFDLRKIKKLGGYKRLCLCPSAGDIKRTIKDKKTQRDFATIHSLVSIFLRLNNYGEEVGLWPSMANSKKLQRRPSLNNDLAKASYKSKKDIENAWAKYKLSSHLIFGVLEATQTSKLEDKKIINNIERALSYAFYAQRALTTVVIQNTKKPTLDLLEINILPEDLKIISTSPDIPPFSKEEITFLKSKK